MIQESTEDGAASSRRASGRTRKPTAKALALSDFTQTRGELEVIDHTNDTPVSRHDQANLAPENEQSKTSVDKSGTPAPACDQHPQVDAATTLQPDTNAEAATEVPVVRSSRRERKPTARALEAGLEEEMDTPSRKRSASPTKDEPTAKVPRKSFGPAPKVPSRLRHSISALDDAPETVNVSDADQINPATPPVNGVDLTTTPTTITKHANQHTKRKEREAAARAAAEAIGMPLPPEPPKSDRPKHPNQHTKRKAREEAARAVAAMGTRSPTQALARQAESSDRRKHPNQHTKRREREAAAEEARPEASILGIYSSPDLHPGEPSFGMPSPHAQERLIVTLPLPGAAGHTKQTFSAGVRKAEVLDKGCQLFCLDAASRILAFAEIAAAMPDSDDDDEDGESPSLYEQWLERGRARFCVCGTINRPPVSSRLTEEELTTFIEPNIVSKSPRLDTSSETSNGSALSLPPVNTIVKAKAGRRASVLYSVIADSAPPPQGLSRRQNTMAPPRRPMVPTPPRRSYSTPTTLDTSKPITIARGSYEKRMREDYMLQQVRQGAKALNIPVTHDMSYDDIRRLLSMKKSEEAAPQSRFMHGHGHAINGFTVELSNKPVSSPPTAMVQKNPSPQSSKLKDGSTKLLGPSPNPLATSISLFRTSSKQSISPQASMNPGARRLSEIAAVD